MHRPPGAPVTLVHFSCPLLLGSERWRRRRRLLPAHARSAALPSGRLPLRHGRAQASASLLLHFFFLILEFLTGGGQVGSPEEGTASGLFAGAHARLGACAPPSSVLVAAPEVSHRGRGTSRMSCPHGSRVAPASQLEVFFTRASARPAGMGFLVRRPFFSLRLGFLVSIRIDSRRFCFFLSSLDLSPTGSMHENGSDSIVRF